MSSSLLLSKILKIKYCGSNIGLKTQLKSFDGEHLILYVDVVPDNDATKSIYNFFKRYIKDEGLTEKVHIILVVCTEYFLIRSLKDMGIKFEYKYPWMKAVDIAVSEKYTIKEFVPRGKYNYEESFKSFEKQCKLLLNNCQYEIMNYNTLDKEDAAALNEISFYLNSSHGMTIEEKALNIAAKLPLVSFINAFPLYPGFKHIYDITSYLENYITSYDKWIETDIKRSLGDKWWEKY